MIKLKFLGSTFYSIIFLFLFLIFIYRYWKTLYRLPLYLKSLLVSLRSTVLLILLLLILNPWFEYKSITKINQNISLIFDFSESMINHFKYINYSYSSVVEKIKDHYDKKNINTSIFTLSKNMEQYKNKIDTISYSYFSKIPELLASQAPDQVLLVTDGVTTSGLSLNSINFSNNIPINVLGVGNTIPFQDISIEKIVFPFQAEEDEEIDIDVFIIADVESKINTLISIKNESGNTIYTEPISISAGSGRKKITIPILANNLNGYNTVSLKALQVEKYLDNNKHKFKLKVNSISERALLISSSLSPNSSLIKSILSKIDRLDVNHFYKTDKNRFNIDFKLKDFESIKLFVLDDYPASNYDIQLFNELYEYCLKNNIPIIYLEGPKSSLLSANIISEKNKIFSYKIIENDKFSNISLDNIKGIYSPINFSLFPPQLRNVNWSSSLSIIDLQYDDGSLLAGGDDSFYLVSMPALMESHLKSRQNSYSPVSNLLNKIFIDKYYGSKGLIKMNIDDDIYERGEMLNVQLFSIKDSDLEELYLKTISPSFDTLLTACENNYINNIYDCNFLLKESGEYRMLGTGFLEDGSIIEGSEESIYAQDINVELEKLIQEDALLRDIAYKTNGLYMPIDSLELMLNSININPLNIVKKNNFSSIKTYKYWWIIIILLSTEWYIRKRVGLL